VLHLEVYRPHRIFTKRAQWLSTWGYVIAWSTVIFISSAQSDLRLPGSLPPFSDKVAHFLIYGLLGWLWSRAVKIRCPSWTTIAVVLSTVAFTGIYGLSDEWHQMYVPGRSAELSDALADVCGGTLGGMGFLVWLLFREENGARTSAGDPDQVPDPFDPAV
jgi:hypothetical protein